MISHLPCACRFMCPPAIACCAMSAFMSCCLALMYVGAVLHLQDFGGFRTVVILPRYVSHWPYPDSLSNREGKLTHPNLGAPLPPFPLLQTHGRPLSAATIRSGPGYLEIPFVATHEGKRGRGYCRCVGLQSSASDKKLRRLMVGTGAVGGVAAGWVVN